jgi:predicted phage tail component-like protein
MPYGITFNGTHSSGIEGLDVVLRYEKDILPDIENILVTIKNRDGVIDGGYTLKERVIPVSFLLRGTDIIDYFKKAEKVAKWLNTGSVKDLKLDAYPDRTFKARIMSRIDPERFARVGKIDVEFLVPHPAADGLLKGHDVYSGSLYNYNGNYKTFPKITLTATTSLSHIKVQKGKRTDLPYGDFRGKTTNNLSVNPHVAKHNAQSTTSGLHTPSSIPIEFGASYEKLATLDGQVGEVSIPNAGVSAQQVFIFDIVAELERQGVYMTGLTRADKVAWIKENVQSIGMDWHGVGKNQAGNKATFTLWRYDNGSWYSPTRTNDTAQITKLNIWTGAMSVFLSPDGYFTGIAYAEPSDGTAPSVIQTDYVDVLITLKSLTNKFILVNRSFVNGDIIVLDTKSRKLTVNGQDIRADLDVSSSWQGMALDSDYSLYFNSGLTAKIEYNEKWV